MRWMLMDASIHRFRWVACQMDYLCELPTDAARRSALKSLPLTLNATYERILRRVSQSNSHVQNLIRRTLQWIVHACQPLSISALCEAVAVEPGCESLKSDAIPAENEILRWCSSLVRKTSSGNSLELAHFTVKEFLVKLSEDPSSDLAIYGLDKVRDDIDLGVVCLTVLLAWDPVDDENSLYAYAVLWWAKHAEYNMANNSIFSLTKQLMNPSAPERLILWAEEFRYLWLQGLSDDQYLSTASPLHFASLLALPQVCNWLIEQGCDVNEATQLGTPLHCALIGYKALEGPDVTLRDSGYCTKNPDPIKDTIRVIVSAGGDARSCYFDAGQLRPREMFNPVCQIEILRFNAVLDHDLPDLIQPEDAYQVLISAGEGHLSYKNHATLLANALQFESYRIDDTFSALDRGQDINQSLLDKYNVCLWFAAKFGQVVVISQLLSDFHLDINMRDPRNGFTALHYAAESGQADAIEFLVRQGADHTVVDLEEKTPFSFLIGIVHSHDLTVYLQLDNDLSQRDKYGHSLWHHAARNRNPDVLSKLTAHAELQHHATSLSASDESHTMPIDCDQTIQHPAVYYNIQSYDATRPLHVAAETGSLEAVRFLLENGADVHAKKVDGSNALHCAVNGESNTTHPDIVHTLIEYGLDPVSSRCDKSTPILILIQRLKGIHANLSAERHMLSMLIQHKPTLTVTDDNGLTVIHHLCQLITPNCISPSPLKSWECRTLQLMLDNGAEMHHLDHAHRTPLKILLDVFREEYLQTSRIRGLPPSFCARVCAKMINATYKYIGHRESLMELWREPDFLILALWVMDDELVESLLQEPIDVDTRCGVTDLTPIQAACRFGSSASLMSVFIKRSAHFFGPVSSASTLVLEACNGLAGGSLKASGYLAALLDAGSDPNSCSQSGTTALMLAAIAGNIEMMDLLILAGANLSATDNKGWTVIHHICLGAGHDEQAVFQKLRIPSVGWISSVSFTWRDREYSNVTALHIAASREYGSALHELLDSGLMHTLDAISDEGGTALMFASTIGNVAHVKLLLRKGANANLVNMSYGQSALHIAAINGHREIASLLV